MPMTQLIAIDSNVLTYLVDALDENYDPSLDRSHLMPERVALVRIYFYCGQPYYVPPTVQKEYQRISNSIKQQAHDRLHQILLLDSGNFNQTAVQYRASMLLNSHNDIDDCTIVAESEFMKMEVLLTSDEDLLTRLARIASIQIVKPSDFLIGLNIQSNIKPMIAPAPSNPFSNLSWWRI